MSMSSGRDQGHRSMEDIIKVIRYSCIVAGGRATSERQSCQWLLPTVNFSSLTTFKRFIEVLMFGVLCEVSSLISF